MKINTRVIAESMNGSAQQQALQFLDAAENALDEAITALESFDEVAADYVETTGIDAYFINYLENFKDGGNPYDMSIPKLRKRVENDWGVEEEEESDEF